MNKSEIQWMINNAPPSWLTMFKRYGLGKKPTVDKLINTVLEYSPTMRSSGERGEAKYKVPAKVKKEAAKGLELAYIHNYTSASGIGLVRAMQLVVKDKIWERSITRMKAYFTRHEVDKQGKHFGDNEKPSRGYMAWLAWGGDSGFAWAKKMVGSKQNPKVSKRSLTNRRNRDTSNIRMPSSWDLPFRKGSRVQTIIFDRKLFNGHSARAWLRKHNFKTPKTEKTVNYLRYRQSEPKMFHKDSFRTLEFKKGIKAVVAIPVKNPKRRQNKGTGPDAFMNSLFDFRSVKVQQRYGNTYIVRKKVFNDDCEVRFLITKFDAKPNAVYLHYMEVIDPYNCRRKGYATRLLTDLKNRATEYGVDIYLWSSPIRHKDEPVMTQDQLNKWYEQRGFENDDVNYENTYVFRGQRKNPKRRRNRWSGDSKGHKGAACKRWEKEGPTEACPKGSSRKLLVAYRASPRGQAARKRLIKRVERSTKGYYRKKTLNAYGFEVFYYYIVAKNRKGEKYLKRVTKQVVESVRK